VKYKYTIVFETNAALDPHDLENAIYTAHLPKTPQTDFSVTEFVRVKQ
jgi:hypothetical protein